MPLQVLSRYDDLAGNAQGEHSFGMRPRAESDASAGLPCGEESRIEGNGDLPASSIDAAGSRPL